MKVRIGIALGQWPLRGIDPESIVDLVDHCEALDVDSVWLSDRLVSQRPLLEPVTFLSYIAGRLRNMDKPADECEHQAVYGNRLDNRKNHYLAGHIG